MIIEQMVAMAPPPNCLVMQPPPALTTLPSFYSYSLKHSTGGDAAVGRRTGSQEGGGRAELVTAGL